MSFGWFVLERSRKMLSNLIHDNFRIHEPPFLLWLRTCTKDSLIKFGNPGSEVRFHSGTCWKIKGDIFTECMTCIIPANLGHGVLLDPMIIAYVTRSFWYLVQDVTQARTYWHWVNCSLSLFPAVQIVSQHPQPHLLSQFTWNQNNRFRSCRSLQHPSLFSQIWDLALLCKSGWIEFV